MESQLPRSIRQALDEAEISLADEASQILATAALAAKHRDTTIQHASKHSLSRSPSGIRRSSSTKKIRASSSTKSLKKTKKKKTSETSANLADKDSSQKQPSVGKAHLSSTPSQSNMKNVIVTDHKTGRTIDAQNHGSSETYDPTQTNKPTIPKMIKPYIPRPLSYTEDEPVNHSVQKSFSPMRSKRPS